MNINIPELARSVVRNIESELDVREDKHGIKTETVKNRILTHFQIDCNDESSQYLAEVGLGQVIQKALQERGYRSVRRGCFINPEDCENIAYLQIICENADREASSKLDVSARMRILKERRDPQIDMMFDGADFDKFSDPITEEEFLEKLMEDCI